MALDAMGVLYEAGDDVADLLIPFVRQHGDRALADEDIERAYLAASLGKMDVETFWKQMGIAPELEDDYLSSHRLIPGTQEVLPALRRRFTRLLSFK